MLSDPQLKSIYNFLKSASSKNSEVKEKGVFWNILSIKYLIFIKGLNACSSDVNSGFPIVALLPVDPLAKSIDPSQFTNGYLIVFAALKPDVPDWE